MKNTANKMVWKQDACKLLLFFMAILHVMNEEFINLKFNAINKKCWMLLIMFCNISLLYLYTLCRVWKKFITSITVNIILVSIWKIVLDIFSFQFSFFYNLFLPLFSMLLQCFSKLYNKKTHEKCIKFWSSF